MSSVRTPVGPQPPSVYWRRRVLVLLGLVAIVVIIVLIVTRPAANSGAPTPSPSPSGSGQPVASGDEEDLCATGSILLEPLTDANPYPTGQQPLISMRITNTGSSPCTLDVGTSEQYYAIVSGSDPIWNSRDCQTAAESLLLVLEPNEPVTTTPFAWDRTRSSPSTCSSARPEVIAAGSTYRLSVSLGDIASESNLAFILN